MRPLSERDAKRVRRADADYATSERDTKRARRADADQKPLLTKANYATFERDAKRARRADADYREDRNLVLYQAGVGTQKAISSWSSLPK